MFCNNFHNALPGSITSKFNCLQIFKFSIFAFHKKKREIFDTKRIKNTSNHCPNRFTVFTQCVNVCEISSFSSANIDHFWKCMNSRENDMARFYRYSSSLKWSEQMTFPMDQICGKKSGQPLILGNYHDLYSMEKIGSILPVHVLRLFSINSN